MENIHKEIYKETLKKTARWQTFLLWGMGFFYTIIILLFLAEVIFSYRNNWFSLIFSGFCVGLFLWVGYIWSKLSGAIKYTRKYLKSEAKQDRVNMYRQQQLFWRSLVLLLGGLVIVVLSLFLGMFLY